MLGSYCPRTIAQVAFDDIQALITEHGEREGMKQFLGTGPDDGWMLPETLRLVDYGIGHDDRAEKHQPVASVLIPRFQDWQLNQTPEEAWAETQRHAENIRHIRSIGLVLEDESLVEDEIPQSDLFGREHDLQPDLF